MINSDADPVVVAAVGELLLDVRLDDAEGAVNSRAAASAGADGEEFAMVVVAVDDEANEHLPDEDDTAGGVARGGWEGEDRGDSKIAVVLLLLPELGGDDNDDADDANNIDDDDGGDGGDVVDITAFTDVNALFQLIFTRLRGGPIGGICCVASARYASFSRCGWVATIFFQPTVSTTSVA